MRILSREEFLKMPAGTFYRTVEQEWIFGELEVKGDTILPWGDFWCMEIGAVDFDDTGDFLDRCEAMKAEGKSFPMNYECQMRDGTFYDESALFLVLEAEDLRRLRDLIDKSLGD